MKQLVYSQPVVLNPHHPRIPEALSCGCCAECGCFCGMLEPPTPERDVGDEDDPEDQEPVRRKEQR